MSDKFIQIVRRLGKPKFGWREECPDENNWYFRKFSKHRSYLVIVKWSTRSIRIQRLR